MPQTRKRDSSYASIPMTRSNGPDRHLLSTFNKRREQPQEEESPDPKTEPETETVSHNEVPEPGIYDDPVSSSDEAELPKPIEEDTVAKRLEEANKPTRKEIWSSSNVSRKRGPSEEENNDQEDMLFSSIMSSRSSQNKRLKAKTYPTNSSFSYSKFPSSSAPSGAGTPDKRSRKQKTLAKKTSSSDEPTSELTELEESESESESEAKPTMETKDSTADNDQPAKPEPEPAFIIPPEYLSDLKSSFGTDNQRMDLDASPKSDASSGLSSAPPSELLDLLEEEEAEPKPRRWLCPMCKEEVDPELLILFEAQPKQRVREQQQFCASHQQNSAEKEWKENKYPEIDWDNFESRIKKFFPNLEKLLVPGTPSPSYFHNILETNMKDGKAKNFRLTIMGDGIENISCGYYGTRGAGKMLQAVVDRFSASLRRLSTSDNIIKTAGVAGYAQSVLVPELAVCLVKEDMGVDDDSARQILRESIHIGQKINPALNDEVPVPVVDEDENEDEL